MKSGHIGTQGTDESGHGADAARGGRGALLPGLREARQDAGLTIRELSNSCGVNEGTISALERGLRGAYPKTTSRLATALGVPVRLLRGKGCL